MVQFDTTSTQSCAVHKNGQLIGCKRRVENLLRDCITMGVATCRHGTHLHNWKVREVKTKYQINKIRKWITKKLLNKIWLYKKANFAVIHFTLLVSGKCYFLKERTVFSTTDCQFAGKRRELLMYSILNGAVYLGPVYMKVGDPR